VPEIDIYAGSALTFDCIAAISISVGPSLSSVVKLTASNPFPINLTFCEVPLVPELAGKGIR